MAVGGLHNDFERRRTPGPSLTSAEFIYGKGPVGGAEHLTAATSAPVQRFWVGIR